MLKYCETEYLDILSRLNSKSLVSVALSCASRLFPAYAAYTHEKNISYYDFENKLIGLWGIIKNDSGTIEKISEAEIASVPDDDDGGYDLSFIASDAISCLIYASWAGADASPQCVVWATQSAYEAFDWAARQRPSMPQDRYDEAALIADPLVQAELREQAIDLATVAKDGDATDFHVMEARAMAARANMQRALEVVLAARG